MRRGAEVPTRAPCGSASMPSTVRSGSRRSPGKWGSGSSAAGRWSAAAPEVDTSAAAVLRSSHGPMVLVDGVPAGYARDQAAGAIASAVREAGEDAESARLIRLGLRALSR